jgi:hypothetical protein
METTKEMLEARVRETPLVDRLKECRQRIGKMCSEGRPPRMCIPLQHDDDDFFISTTLSDAQATVQALQRERDALKLVNEMHMKTVMKLSRIVEQNGAALDAEREKVKELEAKVELQETAVRCAGHALDESRETHNRQGAKIREQQEQLTQLQALVRALKGEASYTYHVDDKPDEDDLYTVYVHVNGQGYGAIAEFYSRDEALAYAEIKRVATLDATTPAVCPDCNGDGAVDSGGTDPNGNPLMRRCGCREKGGDGE